jgi:alkanesulfonate monooxygenase SsuD/methylene tetrahydromethanopterin reductase-like flavin-dependent oxidoreductase (luciferase family)
MTLEFGIFDHLDRNDLPLAEYYEERLKVIEAFDRAGFYAYHVAEHHFTPLGLAPSPSVFLSAIAQRTKRLRFGTFVYALPIHHPVRMIEEICMLDHISNGRLEIGFGRGSVPYEIAYYGENADERQEIYAERLELILQAFEAGEVTFKGKYDTFDRVPLVVEPLQRPHPPMWYGAHSPDSAERAARKGLNIVNNDVPATTRETIARFQKVWREAQDASTPPPKMGMVRFIIVANSDDEALRIARRAYPRWRASFMHLHDLHGTVPGSSLRAGSFDELAGRGLGVAGSPETVTRFLAPQVADSGTNYVVGQMAFGDLSLDEMLRSVALFGRHVMPALRVAAPVKMPA